VGERSLTHRISLPVMPRKAQGPGSRQALILKAAENLFYERSFAAVGVDEIGERAGVTGPAIYRHFRGKDEILSALFDDAIDRLNVATAIQTDDPWEELDALVRGHLQFVMKERKLAGVKLREERSLAEPYRRGLHRRERRYVERWLACLERCYPEHERGELTIGIHVALGALNSIATWSSQAIKEMQGGDVVVAGVLHGLHAFDQSRAERSAA
jgi:AcrR family transcriptional regulator